MAITNFMNLDLPTVSVTLGPEYAFQNNEAFETIDAHDHTSGKGVPIPASGLNINANLNVNSMKTYNLYSTQYIDQAVALTGASNALSVSTTSGDLYYTNGAGNSVQITSGGTVVTSPGTVTAFARTTVSSDITISPSDTFVVLSVDTTSIRDIELPLASTVAEGRIYIIKDRNGLSNTNPITVSRQGSDTINLATSDTINSNFASKMYMGDGISNWEQI